MRHSMFTQNLKKATEGGLFNNATTGGTATGTGTGTGSGGGGFFSGGGGGSGGGFFSGSTGTGTTSNSGGMFSGATTGGAGKSDVTTGSTGAGYGFFNKTGGGSSTSGNYGFFGNRQGTTGQDGKPVVGHRDFYTGTPLIGKMAAAQSSNTGWLSNQTAQQKEFLQKQQAAAAESTMNQARLIIDLQELRPFGEHLLPRRPRARMEDEKMLGLQATKKNAFLDIAAFRPLYSEATRQLDLYRSVPNSLNNKVLNSFSEDYQKMFVSLYKTITGAGVQLKRLAETNETIKEGIKTHILKKSETLVTKMRIVSNKLEIAKAKTRRIDDCVVFVLRCAESFHSYYEDMKAERDVLVRVPATELMDMANYLSLLIKEVIADLKDLMEVVTKDRNTEFTNDYMAHFGESIDMMFAYITSISPRVAKLRSAVSMTLNHHLGIDGVINHTVKRSDNRLTIVDNIIADNCVN